MTDSITDMRYQLIEINAGVQAINCKIMKLFVELWPANGHYAQVWI